MFRSLSPGAIGIRGLGLVDAIALARETGFEGLEVPIVEATHLAAERGIGHVKSLFADAGVRAGSWGLPFRWQEDDAFAAGLADLPRQADVSRELGCLRVSTWVPPGSDTRPMDENRAWHVERFGAIGRALASSGCHLGLEFIGPPTSRNAFKHPFLYSMAQMRDLVQEIGLANLGLLVDAWHVYTAGETSADVAALSPDEVVVVHVNDAPPGIAIDAQEDRVRRMPMETGVIDLAGFMGALKRIGYLGPVVVEPFDRELNDLAARDPRAAAVKKGAALDRLWRTLG